MDERTASSSTDTSSRAAKLRIAVLWRGNVDAPATPAPHEARLAPVIDALARAGFAAEGVVWFDERAGEIEAHLAETQGVLVWINPLAAGRDRAIVDATLRRLAAAGVWVSTHPDVTLAMGTKEVLYTTRDLGWGSNTDLYDSEDAFEHRFWPRIEKGGARVLKPLRGNDGQGVMKVAADGHGLIVQHAGDDRIERLTRNELTAHVRSALRAGAVIDQAFNDNAAAGMVRCYLSQAAVVGFAEQAPRKAGEGAFAMNSAKTMHGRDAPAFADLRRAMETDWVPAMQKLLDLSTERLPALWDADFFYRVQSDARGRFVLCEINVSCVSPFPDAAPEAIAEAARRRLAP
jgi:glutathione synthase/RimK-type ligase-like ATP-grasp enzyme